jgi:hypothetical protein
LKERDNCDILKRGGASMANEEHLKILKQGVEVWNRWRKENPGIWGVNLTGANLFEANLRGVDLSVTDLSEAKLVGADLSRADLSGAGLIRSDLTRASLQESDLSRADLSGADLVGAHLVGADLSETNLSVADLTRANLSGAKLSGANLTAATLRGAKLSGADLSHAITGLTMFSDLDLRVANGLETVEHIAPSTIGIDTIYASKGKIPEAFLRGCGVPDTFIASIASLTYEALPYYSCFISHSHQDTAFAQRLHADLQDKGVRCWLDREDLRGGRKLYDQIDQAIRLHDKLLLVLSEHSIHSEWEMTEIRQARKGELRDGRRKLFPIRLVDWETIKEWECFDADTGKDLAVEVREYFIPDFSNWEVHSSYQPAFDRLLRDLEAEEG